MTQKILTLFTDLLFIGLFLLLTFFGLGPVFLADGSTKERLVTLLVVVILYILWWAGYFILRKKQKRN